METLRNLGVKVDLLAGSNTIEDLVNKTIKQLKKENKELDEETEKSRMIKDIEDNGLKLDDKIGGKLNNIRSVYRGIIGGTKPTPKQVEKIEEDLGISLWEIEKIDTTQEFIEKMETLRNLGVKVDLLAETNTIEDLVNKTIRQLKKENKELDEETEKSRMIKDIEDNGLKLDDKIGGKLNNIRSVYRGIIGGTKPTPKQVEKIEEDLGISLWEIEKIDTTQEFIEKMETLRNLGVKVDLLAVTNTIEDLVNKTIKQLKKENKELDEETEKSRMIKDIEDNGLKLDDNIGGKLNSIRSVYRGIIGGTKPTPKQVEKIEEDLGISLEYIEKIDTIQEFIEKMEILRNLGVKVYLLATINTIGDLVNKTIRQLKKENKELDEETEKSRMIKDIEDNGLKLDDNIGSKLKYIREAYRGSKKNAKEPTPKQVEKIEEDLGIKLEKKRKSKKEIAEAAFPAITDPDLLDSEQQALDTLISKTEEKGGKNGQKQQS
mgnify:CR=1 FL=1